MLDHAYIFDTFTDNFIFIETDFHKKQTFCAAQAAAPLALAPLVLNVSERSWV